MSVYSHSNFSCSLGLRLVRSDLLCCVTSFNILPVPCCISVFSSRLQRSMQRKQLVRKDHSCDGCGN
ncbi:hypothetical protein C8Q78DRAFT_791627 [Trametes maxima]|nr:hypothetical protein C8Q78DRAFT_791627 [Trametes maxima]